MSGPVFIAHRNELSCMEWELLMLLTERCGALIAFASEIMRYGKSGKPSREIIDGIFFLEQEMGEVRAAMIRLCELGLTDKDHIHRSAEMALERQISPGHLAPRKPK